MTFVVTQMDLEIVILSEASQTEKDKYCIMSLYVESKKKNDTNELIYKIKIDSQIQNTNLWLPREKWGRHKLEEGDCYIHTTINKTDNK